MGVSFRFHKSSKVGNDMKGLKDKFTFTKKKQMLIFFAGKKIAFTIFLKEPGKNCTCD